MVTLTLKNSESLAKLAALTGWTADHLVNHLLTDTFNEFDDVFAGSLEGFLGAICYPDRTSAQGALDRVTEITREQFDGQLPDSFKSEIFEPPDGSIRFPRRVHQPAGRAVPDLLK